MTRSLFHKYSVQQLNLIFRIWFHWYLHSWSLNALLCSLNYQLMLCQLIICCPNLYLWRHGILSSWDVVNTSYESLVKLSDIFKYLKKITNYHCTFLSSFCFFCLLADQITIFSNNGKQKDYMPNIVVLSCLFLVYTFSKLFLIGNILR